MDRPCFAGFLIILTIIGAASFSIYQLNKGAFPERTVNQINERLATG